MVYALLCYNSENVIGAWTKEQDDEVMAKLTAITGKLERRGKLGPVARLAPTRTAKTLWKDRQPHLITDGPYAETKEAILGFYVFDCETEEEALAIARELGDANPGGVYELRPVTYLQTATLANQHPVFAAE
jgi:hypothetical protein